MKTLKSMRLQIGFFGKTNVGKSLLINSIAGQDVSIVSETKGTTTDTVEKSMELLPIGPVTLLDTAGLDDSTELAEKRIEKTFKIINRVDVAVVVVDFNGIDELERALITRFESLKIPYCFIVNKSDIELISTEALNQIINISENFLVTSAVSDKGLVDGVKALLLKTLPDDVINTPTILGDLLPPKSTVILVTPIDKEAPKGRLILPQVQTIRDLLDNDCVSLVVKESELQQALNSLKDPPALVVTDSQAFKTVNEIVPHNIHLTSFSILLARLKGDLKQFLNGVEAIENLKWKDKVLFLESCTHHVIEDDIAKVKIPKLLVSKLGFELDFEYYSGHDMPEIANYKLIIHCGACMTNRREILSRILIANNKNVPITNYGIIISYCLGILPRAVKIFETEECAGKYEKEN